MVHTTHCEVQPLDKGWAWVLAAPMAHHHPDNGSQWDMLLQKKIKSITITGHSLGGALSSLCGFDINTAITEATIGISVATPGARQREVYADRQKWVQRSLGEKAGTWLTETLARWTGTKPLVRLCLMVVLYKHQLESLRLLLHVSSCMLGLT